MTDPRTSKPDVLFITSVWQGNLISALKQGAIEISAMQHCFPFSERVLMINNVDDRRAVTRLAERAVERGEIDRYLWVADLQTAAFKLLGVKPQNFGRFLNWANVHLVSLALPLLEGSERFVFIADPESPLIEPCDWISDSVEAIRKDSTICCATPAWQPEGHPLDTWAKESVARFEDGGLVLGYSDINCLFDPYQLKVCRRTLSSVAWWSAPISARFPSPGFKLHDARLDAWMRVNGFVRFVNPNARFLPTPTAGGNSRYEPKDSLERAAALRDHVLLKLCRARKWNSTRLSDGPQSCEVATS